MAGVLDSRFRGNDGGGGNDGGEREWRPGGVWQGVDSRFRGNDGGGGNGGRGPE